MVVVKSVGVWSFAKIEALMLAVFGLIEGILIAIMAAVDPGTAMQSQGVPELLLGPWAILVLPIVYAIFGLVIGALGAAVYNLFAKWIGGIELELETKAEPRVDILAPEAKAAPTRKKR